MTPRASRSRLTSRLTICECHPECHCHPELVEGCATTGPRSGHDAEPLLVATRYILVYVDGDKRQSASAGARHRQYRLLGTLADGSALVSYNDAGALDGRSDPPSI